MDIIYDQSQIMSKTPKSIGAAKFKEQCLQLLDHLEPEGLIVTKHGKPVATVIPIPQSQAEMIGALKGRLNIKGDIQSTGIAWDADAES